ncbi:MULTISPECIES: DUF2617 family protein [Rhodococcus]|uniref:DUF2617 family protein n=1 Tax=Rhodococcus TaxID=1827 RepID=UPI001022542E|nr:MULTISPECIES: DUF2617 family protein [Rhodococcus]UTT47237.1 DUF2617 family protein [Rhodococcus gordoniae]
MSTHILDIVPRDVSASALGLVLDAPAPPPLVSARLTDSAAGILTLGVLGASHVVTAQSGRRTLTEQVSCDAVGAGGHPLPERHDRDGYLFRSRTATVQRAELAQRANRLRATARSAPGWLCAAFPGDDDALTVLSGTADAGEWHWRTWHLYPSVDTGVIVETESRWRP